MRTRTGKAEETEELGARLAGAWPRSDALAVLYLQGELGSGKTTFARGFARAAGVGTPVRSPTYTLLELYPAAGSMTLVHLDLYRVQSPAELESLGLREWARAGHTWLIEWPEHGSGRLPAADLVVRLAASTAGHDVEVSAASALGTAWLVQLESGRRTP